MAIIEDPRERGKGWMQAEKLQPWEQIGQPSDCPEVYKGLDKGIFCSMVREMVLEDG